MALLEQENPKGDIIVGMPNIAAAGKNGFLHIPIVTAAPTGVPDTYSGFAPICLLDNGGGGGYKLYVYSPAASAWKSATVA